MKTSRTIHGSVRPPQSMPAMASLTTNLPAAAQSAADSSLAGALAVAQQLPAEVGQPLAAGATDAFVDGIHLAVTVGAALAWIAAAVVVRYLPRHLAHDAGPVDATDAVEDVLELGLAGVEPVFPHQAFPPDPTPAADPAR